MLAKLKTFQISEKNIPWIILLIHIMGFGLLAVRSGFYQDDWHFVYYALTQGADGMVNLMNVDGHPMAAWSYILFFQLLGYNPLYWQLFSFALRGLTILIFWVVLNQIWPDHKRGTLAAALLFDLYPTFILQSQSIAYFEIWLSYIFLGLSFYYSIRAIKEPKRATLFIILAVVWKLFHSFTSETTWGTELMRPFLLWLAITEPETNRNKFKRVAAHSLIYIFFFALSGIWRGIIFKSPRNADIVFSLLSNPLATIRDVIVNGIQDMVVILVTSWYNVVRSSMFNITERSNLILIAFVIISAVIVYFSMAKIREKDSEQSDKNWTSGALITGIAGLLFGIMPFYAAGFFIHNKIAPWNGRFALGSLLGAALILVAIIQWLITDKRKQNLVFALFIGLSVAWHTYVGNDFYWAWNKQVTFYQQLQLRAPSISPGTIILSEDEFLPYMGDYPTAFSINTLYAQKQDSDSTEIPLWFYPLSSFHNKFDQYLAGTELIEERALMVFHGNSKDSLVVSFDPGMGQCLWIMQPEYARSKSFSQTMRQLSTISNVDRIKQAPLTEDSFLLKYLRAAPPQDWCYYYEKADLAYQYRDWDEVLTLWDAARQRDLQPGHGFELLPFIEAHAHTNDWKTAESLTLSSQKTAQGIDPLLCDIWSKLENDTAPSPEKDNVVVSVKEELKCGQE